VVCFFKRIHTDSSHGSLGAWLIASGHWALSYSILIYVFYMLLLYNHVSFENKATLRINVIKKSATYFFRKQMCICWSLRKNAYIFPTDVFHAQHTIVQISNITNDVCIQSRYMNITHLTATVYCLFLCLVIVQKCCQHVNLFRKIPMQSTSKQAKLNDFTPKYIE